MATSPASERSHHTHTVVRGRRAPLWPRAATTPLVKRSPQGRVVAVDDTGHGGPALQEERRTSNLVHHRDYRAMGSRIELIAVGVDNATADLALAAAREFAEGWEERFSRFRPQSELSRLNESAGRPMPVSAGFLAVLEAALAAYKRTDGLFDPSILPSLTALGYDRDFREVQSSPEIARRIVPEPGLVERIVIDRRVGAVTLPPGCALDFGGIAKGIFVDRLAERFAALAGWEHQRRR